MAVITENTFEALKKGYKEDVEYYRGLWQEASNKKAMLELRLMAIETLLRELCNEWPYGENGIIDNLRQYVWNADDTEEKIRLEGYDAS